MSVNQTQGKRGYVSYKVAGNMRNLYRQCDNSQKTWLREERKYKPNWEQIKW